MKKKLGRPAKKVIESFVEIPKPKEEVFNPPHVEEKTILCECGKAAQPASHQCWACAHRA